MKFFDFQPDHRAGRTFINLDRVLAFYQINATTSFEVELGGGVSVTIPEREAERFMNALRGRQ